MRKVRLEAFLISALFFIFFINIHEATTQSIEKDILQTMEKASSFMMNTVSYNGGFVWNYSFDLSEQWGEVPARKTMIWVQEPGTVGVGEIMLKIWQKTSKPEYLKYAEKVANALIWGQLPAGGWHYFIDFDMTGVQKWYDNVGSKCWGWEEYYHYYGNCTFDDNVTTGAAKYLLDLYMATLDPKYRIPLIKALDFILDSQYPNGAWPQRYPLKYDYPHNGHPDYTSYYTFNDGVISNNIYFLLESWEKLGNEEYKKAAFRGMDFYLISQLPAPQAGWGQQYDTNMKSAAARSYEPASVMPEYTRDNINDLMNFYKITGDRKYLAGIPAALQWLESSRLPEGYNKINNNVAYATFYELGTNKPLYAHREGTSIETGRYWVDYEPKNFLFHYGAQTQIDVAGLKSEFERVAALSPDEAITEFNRIKDTRKTPPKIEYETIAKIIKSLDNRGAWTEEISIPDYKDLINNPKRTLSGISVATFINNMNSLLYYYETIKK